MNQSDGKLSPEDKDKVAKWIDEKAINHKCPVCSQNSWGIADHVVALQPDYKGSMVVGGPAYPAVMVYCSNCFYTRHFMAVPLGVPSEEGREDDR